MATGTIFWTRFAKNSIIIKFHTTERMISTFKKKKKNYINKEVHYEILEVPPRLL